MSFPKTLQIRNQHGGMIWQIYHVNNQQEADILSANALRNGFKSQILVDYDPSYEETWPDWRETEGWKDILKNIS